MSKNDYDRDVYRSMAMITQFGLNMIVPIVLCGALGLFLDKKLGTNWIAIVGFFIGALAGFRNIYVFAKKIYEKPGLTRRQIERRQRKIAKESEAESEGSSKPSDETPKQGA
ncbi:MAG: AtpZ/AtpI family protein [Lachnospiraceae bacterium]|nr:AtpZ/AtpI family protein [Lachnospiraceae bacterium]